MNKKTKSELDTAVLAIIIGSLAVMVVIFQFQTFVGTNRSPHGMIDIQKINWNNNTGQIKAYVQNYGCPEAINQVYVNGKLDGQALIVPSRTLAFNQTCEITLSQTYVTMPPQITVAINLTDGYVCRGTTFVGFEMLALNWNESTQKIEALITDTGQYRQVYFGNVYVNGTEDNGATISNMHYPQVPGQIFKISLSGTYPSKPQSLLLNFTADGSSFNMTAPFTTDMIMNSAAWDEKTRQITFLVYSPYFGLEGKPVSFDGVYVNGIPDEAPLVSKVYSQTYKITLSTEYAEAPTGLTIGIMTDYGAFNVQEFELGSQGFYYSAPLC